MAAGLSLLLAGYPAHAEFLALMRSSTQTSVSWLYNSASTVAIENLRLLNDPQAHANRASGLPYSMGGRHAVDHRRVVLLSSSGACRRTQAPWRDPTRRLFLSSAVVNVWDRVNADRLGTLSLGVVLAADLRVRGRRSAAASGSGTRVCGVFPGGRPELCLGPMASCALERGHLGGGDSGGTDQRGAVSAIGRVVHGLHRHHG